MLETAKFLTRTARRTFLALFPASTQKGLAKIIFLDLASRLKCRNGALNQSGASKFCRSANQDRVILPSIEGKLRKNALCLNESAFSNFALYVIRIVIRKAKNSCNMRHYKHNSRVAQQGCKICILQLGVSNAHKIFQLLAKFGRCSICSKNLDECSLARARKNFLQLLACLHSLSKIA